MKSSPAKLAIALFIGIVPSVGQEVQVPTRLYPTVQLLVSGKDNALNKRVTDYVKRELRAVPVLIVDNEPQVVISIIAASLPEDGRTANSFALAEHITAPNRMDLWDKDYGLSGRVEDWRIKLLSGMLHSLSAEVGDSLRVGRSNDLESACKQAVVELVAKWDSIDRELWNCCHPAK